MIYNNDNNINQAKTLDEENPQNENQSNNDLIGIDDIITKNADLIIKTIDLTQSDNQNYSNVKDINKSNENRTFKYKA